MRQLAIGATITALAFLLLSPVAPWAPILALACIGGLLLALAYRKNALRDA